MAFDAHKNLAVSLVATAPSPATTGGSLVVSSGHGARFPAVPFNATVWPVNTLPDPANAEIVRVTAISTDTLTITRGQESTAARSVIVGDQIAATITAKTLTDIEASRSYAYATKTFANTGYTATATDEILRWDTSGGNCIQNMPAAASFAGKVWTIKKVTAANSLTIEPNAAETIDGATNLVVNAQYAAYTVFSNGTNLEII